VTELDVDVEVAFDESPEYSAVSELAPSSRLLTDREHAPDDNVHVPIVVEPFLNVTVPVALEGVIVAVKDTGEPTDEDEPLTPNATDVDNKLTVTVDADDVEELLFASPKYSAVNELAPSGRVLREMEQLPEERVHDPSKTEPLRKFIVPVADVGFTLPVNVTEDPRVDVEALGVKVDTVEAT
jgi:hypothetical protein